MWVDVDQCASLHVEAIVGPGRAELAGVASDAEKVSGVGLLVNRGSLDAAAVGSRVSSSTSPACCSPGREGAQQAPVGGPNFLGQ